MSDEERNAKLELIEEMLERTANRNCYYELRLWLKTKKFDIEQE